MNRADSAGLPAFLILFLKGSGEYLFERQICAAGTTRDVVLTLTGAALLDRSTDIINGLSEALDYVGSLGGQPRGTLKISAGVGFGINVLAEQLPEFMKRYPEIDITLDLESRTADLVAESVDVALRLGPLADSGLVTVRLGEMRRYMCGARLSRTSRHAEVDRGDCAT